MEKSRTRQGPLPHLHELSGRRGLDAIKARGTSRAKCGTYALVHNLSSREKACNRQLPPVAEVYPDPATIVLQLL